MYDFASWYHDATQALEIAAEAAVKNNGKSISNEIFGSIEYKWHQKHDTSSNVSKKVTKETNTTTGAVFTKPVESKQSDVKKSTEAKHSDKKSEEAKQSEGETEKASAESSTHRARATRRRRFVFQSCKVDWLSVCIDETETLRETIQFSILSN